MSSIDPQVTTAGGPHHEHRLTAGAVALVAVVIALCVAVSVTAYALVQSPSAAAATTPPGTITVTGTGTIEGRPNTVQFSMGIHTLAPTASDALAENNAQVARLIGTFVRYRVPQDQMQTTNVSIYEQTNDHGVFTGFAVDDDLEVTVSDIGIAGKVIDAAVQAVGGDISFNGVSFKFANRSSLLASARARAMQDAATVGRELAAGGNETLGDIVRVTDEESSAPSPVHYFGLNAGAATSFGAIPLETGQTPVSVTVTVVYDLNP